MVKKRRKVWWIVSCVMAILAVVYTWLTAVNSPDARMMATLNDIFVQYDFEQSGEDVFKIVGGPDYPTDMYDSEGLSAVEADMILRIVGESCQGCTVGTGSWTVSPGVWLNDIPGAYILDTDDSYQSIREIWLIKGKSLYGPESDDDLAVAIWVGRRSRLNLLDHIKNLWPW